MSTRKKQEKYICKSKYIKFFFRNKKVLILEQIIDKLDLIKILNILLDKRYHNMKVNPSNGKTFTMSHKESVSTIYNELLNRNNIKTKEQLEMGKRLPKVSYIFYHQEMQINTTTRDYFTNTTEFAKITHPHTQ